MKKKAIESISKVLPNFISNAAEYLKDNFDENGKDIIGDASGTVVAITKLFTQPLIDKYFENLKDKKLKDFGFNIYLKAALVQANKSMEELKEELNSGLAPETIFNSLDDFLSEELNSFDPSNILLIFQPKYHPAVVLIKDNCKRILRKLKTNSLVIQSFLKHFNENIEKQIVDEFGSDYDSHIQEIDSFRLKESETNFLWDMSQLGIIGMRDSENLKYEQTFAYWRKVSALREKEPENLDAENHEKQERALRPIEELIDEYFSVEPKNNLDHILFIVADFGKGKSVFLKHYAAKLAKEYLSTGDGFFPIYFNLRNFKSYSSEPKLGVISDYLESKYSIKIDNDYFKNKNYVFLIDSLDENGELNKANIDKVVSSVKNIQGIDKTIYKTNRIIISSRPFDDGLTDHLNNHKPHIIKNDEGREIPYFVSVYGFKKEQFNDWLLTSLESMEELNSIKANGLTKEIIEAIKSKADIDIYEKLIKDDTLSRGEMRRPIFAYMIYQLISNNVDFTAIGKIGIYLSFINLLTKDAKHIHDPNYPINLKKEFEFRNILHATASLWMYERQRGKQGSLKKADICRVLEGENKQETDIEILERYKNQGITEIQFFSHSYFGENNNILHFQHQSFAEILLAEYYLKVFIKYALDEEFNTEEARVKLILGEPTEQTIQFLKELLRLLKDTTIEGQAINLLEKRKLLFPLMASLATKKHNNLFCNNIYYEWFNKLNIPEDKSEYPSEAFSEWCITPEKMNRIIMLAEKIIESKNSYLLTKAEEKTSLYNKEIISIQNTKIKDLPPDIDRWLSLLVGNKLFNNEKEETYFAGRIMNFENLFDMIRNWNYAFACAAPKWGQKLFKGINMSKTNSFTDMSHLVLSGLDFSYSYLKKFESWHSRIRDCKFNYVEFENVKFNFSDLNNSQFQNIRNIKDGLSLHYSVIFSGVDAPHSFCTKIDNIQRTLNHDEGNVLINDHDLHFMAAVYEENNPIEGILIYGLMSGLFSIKEIKSWFKFNSKGAQKKFFAMFIDKLNKYES